MCPLLLPGPQWPLAGRQSTRGRSYMGARTGVGWHEDGEEYNIEQQKTVIIKHLSKMHCMRRHTLVLARYPSKYNINMYTYSTSW